MVKVITKKHPTRYILLMKEDGKDLGQYYFPNTMERQMLIDHINEENEARLPNEPQIEYMEYKDELPWGSSI